MRTLKRIKKSNKSTSKKQLKRRKKKRVSPRYLASEDYNFSNESKSLTNLQARLVEEYVKDFNGYRAYKAAGGKANGNAASACATQILNYPHVRRAIREKQREMREQSGVEAMDVVKELMRIGFADMKDFAKWTSGSVTLRPSDSLNSTLTCAVQEISEVSGKMGSTVKIKLHPKIQALKMLGEHLNLFGQGEQDEETVENKAQKIRQAVNDIFNSVPVSEPPPPEPPKRKVVKLKRRE